MSKLTRHDQPSSETANLASLYVLGTLAEGAHSDFEQHLMEGCRVCDSEVKRVSAILAALGEAAAPTMPSGIRERFQTRVQNEHVLAKETAGKGILVRESGVLIARTEAMEWRAGPFPGIWFKPLFLDQQQQRTTSLVRMGPGTHYPSHRHNGPEELFLLEGDFVIEGLVMRSGDYCNAQPASVHGESYTAAGCLFILSACQFDQVLS
jgi:anti-sigma factor ChrR (cupin superfamily)